MRQGAAVKTFTLGVLGRGLTLLALDERGQRFPQLRQRYGDGRIRAR